jgi:hypothetical protein
MKEASQPSQAVTHLKAVMTLSLEIRKNLHIFQPDNITFTRIRVMYSIFQNVP